MKYKQLTELICLVCIVLIYGALNSRIYISNQTPIYYSITKCSNASLFLLLLPLGGKKVNEDDDIEDDVREMIDMIDKRKFGPSDETDPPGWETDTRYEKEMRVGKVKKGGKAAPGRFKCFTRINIFSV
ncbi:hypothetical protein KSF78_0005075 [Schistosoma japonicum]|nr:hypothetical protein KSF78_0005075 [Schistosoma japonicum]